MPTTSIRRAKTLLLAALLLAGCVSDRSTPPAGLPSTEPPPNSPGLPAPRPTLAPRPTRAPDLGCRKIIEDVAERSAGPEPTLPPNPNPTIAGGDARVIRALRQAAERLEALDSYQFSVDTYGINPIGLELITVDYSLRGTITQSSGFAMDTLVGMRMREFDNEAAVSSGGRWVVAGDVTWVTDNFTDDLQPYRGPSGASGEAAFRKSFTPDGLAGRLVLPFAAGYRRVGRERHGGAMTDHYRATPKGLAAYVAEFEFKGELTADAWVAVEGGHLSALRIVGKASHVNAAGDVVDDSIRLQFEVTHPNDPSNVVEHPVPPLPEPARPIRAPVDLRMEFEVLRSEIRDPTTQDVERVGATLRQRLATYDHPIKVTVGQPDRVIVTVCGATRPEDDRRLILSTGALTVVPLPASEYGTAARRGPKAIPPVGGPIPPALTPIAPAMRANTGSYVDPATGRRGVAFQLLRDAREPFRAYAAAHRGEHVAVVVDGNVLATLVIDNRLMTGLFAISGDYTVEEARRLVAMLGAEPLAFELRMVREREVPTTR